MKRATALAVVAKQHLAITVFGSNDNSGGSEANARARAARAQWLALALAARGFDGARTSDEAGPGAPNMRAAYVRAVVEVAP